MHQGILFVPFARGTTVVSPILQHAGRLVVAVACHCLDGEACIGLQFVGQGSVAHVRHLVYGSPFPAYEHVVLVRCQIFVHRRHHIVRIPKSEVVLGKFPKDIFALVERVGGFSGVEPFLVACAVGSVSAEAPVRMQVAGGHSAQAETGTVHVVAGNHGVDRTEVELAGVFLAARFHKVLYQCLRTEYEVLETRYLLDAVHEHIHGTFLLGERHLAYLRPIFIAFGKHVGLFDDTPFQAEKAGLYLVKPVIAVFGGALHFHALYSFHQGKFHGHVIIGEHPVAVGQLFELLHDVEVPHKVDTRLLGQVHHGFLYGIGGVLHHVQMPGKAEVLRVLGHESEVHTLLLVHRKRIHKVELIETDGSAPDRADKTALQQADIIVVDVDIGEYIGKDGAQHIARIEELLDAVGVHAFDNGFLAFGTLAVDGL